MNNNFLGLEAAPVLRPAYISGFIDGEGSFGIYLQKNSKYQLGYQVKYEFAIVVHSKDRALLEKIKLSFNGVGGLDKHGKLSVKFRVSSIKDISILIDHLDKYPLKTQKLADYLLFKRAFELVQRKEHYTPTGFCEILSIRAAMNLGLSDSLKEAFSDVVSAERPKVEDHMISDPNWLAGFVEAEGCFYIGITKPSGKAGGWVQLKFKITQHSRDALLMESLVKYLDCGNVYTKSSVDVMDYEVKKLSDLAEKIVPFFKKYPLEGAKKENFEDFCRAVSLVESGAHLTKSGLEEIIRIKSGMNTQRKFEK
jgi:hypothetical protein